jgi:acetyl-CoA carboxylase biotin carboxyl carrier protein
MAQNMTDLDFLRGLIDAVDQSGIDSLEINRSGTRIRIAKTPAAAVSPFVVAPARCSTAPLAPAPAPRPAPAQPAPAGGPGRHRPRSRPARPATWST